MGFISSLATGSAHHKADDPSLRRSPTDQGRGRALWQQVFATNKEAGGEASQFPKVRPTPGGSYARSSLATDASFKRLLQAMRSMAPGNWSDDRWEQTSRHFTGITYVAVHRICMRLQQCEFQVFHKDPRHPDGKRSVRENETTAERNGPYDLVRLLERPNNQDSFGKWLYRIFQQKYLTGTALNWLIPNRLGCPMEMYCIPTALAIPQPAVNPDYPDGYYRIQPVYPYGPFSSYPCPSSAVGAAVSAEWMMRFQYPHPLYRFDGYSPLTGLRLHIDELEMMDRSRHYKMRRSSNPDAVLNFEEQEGMEPMPGHEIDRIRTEWENEHQGPENHGRLIVGTPGAKLEPWQGPSPREMDYSNSWEQLTGFIMGGFGITKPAAGMVEDSAYSTLFATLKQLNLLTLDPETDDLALELTRHLAPYFGDDLIVEIRCKRIDDHDLKFQKLNILCQQKAITKNQLLKELDMPTTDEDWGDDIAGTDPMQQQQMMGGMPGMGAPPGAPPGGAPGGMDLGAMFGGAMGGPPGGDPNAAPPPDMGAPAGGPGGEMGGANPNMMAPPPDQQGMPPQGAPPPQGMEDLPPDDTLASLDEEGLADLDAQLQELTGIDFDEEPGEEEEMGSIDEELQDIEEELAALAPPRAPAAKSRKQFSLPAPRIRNRMQQATSAEPPEISRSRPRPGKLSRGALGPRMKRLRPSTNGYH